MWPTNKTKAPLAGSSGAGAALTKTNLTQAAFLLPAYAHRLSPGYATDSPLSVGRPASFRFLRFRRCALAWGASIWLVLACARFSAQLELADLVFFSARAQTFPARDREASLHVERTSIGDLREWKTDEVLEASHREKERDRERETKRGRASKRHHHHHHQFTEKGGEARQQLQARDLLISSLVLEKNNALTKFRAAFIVVVREACFGGRRKWAPLPFCFFLSLGQSSESGMEVARLRRPREELSDFYRRSTAESLREASRVPLCSTSKVPKRCC